MRQRTKQLEINSDAILDKPTMKHHNSNEIFFFSPISFAFPSLQTLGEDLVTVLDYLHVKYVIGLGEGAG